MPGRFGLEMHQSVFLASIMVLATCGVGGQTPPLPNPSVTEGTQTPLSATDAVVDKGLFTIDVSVTNAGGSPVSDLAARDLTVLDNGQPAKIRTFNHTSAPSEPASNLIFVIDTVNLTPQQLTEAESSLVRFLQRSNGHLPFQCSFYRLTSDGLFSSLRSSMDGALLIEELKETRSLLPVWRAELGSWESGLTPNRLSLRALGAIAIDQRDVPGHKILVWIGPGWPVNGGDVSFDEATEFSTRLREARITLDNLNVWLSPIAPFNYRDLLDAPRSQKDMQPAKMALQVIATHTGGLVLDSSEDLDLDIERCVQEIQSFYTLTFNPPHTDRIDEYHDLRVALRAGVAHPAIAIRAPTGYYNEPVYFDNPRPGLEKVTVTQLEEVVHSRTDLSRKLANLELTEHMSTPRLESLLGEVRREKDRQALTADADLSIALPPPPDDIVNRPSPPLGEQRAILQRTFEYLRNAIPKLPDFYALRTTARFEEPPERDNQSWKTRQEDETLHFAAGEHATVLYRNGIEEVEQKKKLGKKPVVRRGRARELETTGTFGPILNFVIAAAASNPSSFKWQRWERSKDGDMAVFTFKASGASNVPELTFCCLPEGDGTTVYRSRADDFAEIAVNPDSGGIMRITINADLDEERDPDVPLIRSQIMVEYGPEQLGGKTYICPRHAVEVSRARTVRQLHQWGMVFSVYSYFETMINDMSFGGFHKFGSEARILSGFEQTEEIRTPAPNNKPH